MRGNFHKMKRGEFRKRQLSTTFMVPDVIDLLKEIRSKGIQFKSREEVHNALVVQMNKLHRNYMDRKKAAIKEEGGDIG